MKISADNLLGSARRISSQRDTLKGSEKGSSERSDRADIAAKVDSRLDAVSNELKEVQTDLSSKQAVKEGLGKIIEDFQKGGNVSNLLNEVRFNDKKVLLDFLGGNEDSLSMQLLSKKSDELDKLIMLDTNKLTKLQVESANIFASNLVKEDKADQIMKNLNDFMGTSGYPENFSRLNPETVMRLVR
jgi:hypothetical protein